MWLINQHGFLSIVEKPEQEDTGMVTVRGRDGLSVAHLARFLGHDDPKGVISRSSDTDYPFRMLASKVDMARYAAELIMDIDYDNFKDRITIRRGKVWHDALLLVWSDLLAVTPSRVRNWQRKEREARNAKRRAQYRREYVASR